MRRGILVIVFVIALFVSSFLLNDGNTDMTADMGTATFPTVSFETEGYEVNLLSGHKNEMEITAMRDTITPVPANGELQTNIQFYDQTVESVKYQVYSLDGKEKLLEESENSVKEAMTLQVGDALKNTEEAVLKITVYLSDEYPIYYYTRITSDEDLEMAECLKHVENLHTNMMSGGDTDIVKRAMEENASGDNSTLQHVDIHSNLEHSTWGKLNPEIVSDVLYEIKETKEAYTSVLLNYRVKCVGDNNDEELYSVNEFFRVSHVDGKSYLLTYDRTSNEIFDGSNVVLTSKGINLGLTTKDAQYKVNQEGTMVAFVQANELWAYNKEASEFSLVFSFADSEKEDVRNYVDDHSIRILSMDENGSVTFGVYGYMNRGKHEGESGVAIYYFNMSQNSVEEKVFIPSNQSRTMIEDEIGELAFYSNETGALYVLMEDSLYSIDLKREEKTALLSGMNSREYVASSDGRYFAYQTNEDATEVEVLNFQNMEASNVVKAEEGEMIRPLGFVAGDFVYGVAKLSDVGETSSGETVKAIYKVEIRDEKNQLVKTYQADGIYVLDAEIGSNRVTLERAVKRAGIYERTAEDYITNNEESGNSVTLQSYWTDLKETQFRLVFDDGIDNKKAKVLKPKQVLFEHNTAIVMEQEPQGKFYSVYGLGYMQGLYSEAGEALEKADEVSGVVVTPSQRYAWEDGNRVSWYRNFNIKAFKAEAGESTLEASVRAILEYEGKTVDAAEEMKSKSAFEVLNKYVDGEAVRFQGCSAADVRYLIDKEKPVIAMTGSSSAIVLIGYDAETVTYIDPESGAIRNRKFAEVNEMMEASGNTFIGYVE